MERERTVGLEHLTVLGIDPYDPRLSAELWRFVPDDADAIYRPRFASPSSAALARAFLANPPVTAVVLVLIGHRRLFRGEEPPAEVTVEEIADRVGSDAVLDVDPLDGVHDQGPWWTIGAWVTLFVGVGLLAALAVEPGPATALLGLVAIPLLASFVLAHGGAHIQRRDRAIFDAVVARAAERGHERPVVIVRERHVPGIADHAKDALVETEARRVSEELTLDESVY